MTKKLACRYNNDRTETVNTMLATEVPAYIRKTRDGAYYSIFDYLEWADERTARYARDLVSDLKKTNKEFFDRHISYKIVKNGLGKSTRTAVATLEGCQEVSEETRKHKGVVGKASYIPIMDIEFIRDMLPEGCNAQIKLAKDGSLNVPDLMYAFLKREIRWGLVTNYIKKTDPASYLEIEKVILRRHFPGNRNTTYQPHAVKPEDSRVVVKAIILYKEHLLNLPAVSKRTQNALDSNRIPEVTKTYSDRGRVGVDYYELEAELEAIAQNESISIAGAARNMLVRGMRKTGVVVPDSEIPDCHPTYRPKSKEHGSRSLDLGGVKAILLPIARKNQMSMAETIRDFIRVGLEGYKY